MMTALRNIARAPARLAAVILMAAALACGGGDSPTGPGGDGGDGGGGGGGGGGGALANGTMTAQLNGKPWKATFLVQTTLVTNPTSGSTSFQVTGVDTTGVGLTQGRQIIITVVQNSPLATGSFPIGYVKPALAYSSSGSLVHATNNWTTPISAISPTGSGTLVITSLTAERVAGTFFFTAPPYVGNAADAKSPAVITDGKFDLKIKSGG